MYVAGDYKKTKLTRKITLTKIRETRMQLSLPILDKQNEVERILY